MTKLKVFFDSGTENRTEKTIYLGLNRIMRNQLKSFGGVDNIGKVILREDGKIGFSIIDENKIIFNLTGDE